MQGDVHIVVEDLGSLTTARPACRHAVLENTDHLVKEAIQAYGFTDGVIEGKEQAGNLGSENAHIDHLMIVIRSQEAAGFHCLMKVEFVDVRVLGSSGYQARVVFVFEKAHLLRVLDAHGHDADHRGYRQHPFVVRPGEAEQGNAARGGR